MKKLIVVLFLALFSAPLSHATTLADVWDGLAAEPHASIGESIIPVFAYDFNNGVSRSGGVTPFFRVGPFSLDSGALSDVGDGYTTPVLGGSVSVDKLLRIVLPSASDFLRAMFPQSSQNLINKLIIGVAPIYNFNGPENQSSLILAVYSGVEIKF